MKRTPLKRKTMLLRRSPLKAAPPKRLEPERALAIWCELGLAGCYGRATDRHERKKRSQGGNGSRENTLDLCRSCHDWIGANQFASYSQGFLVEHWRNPGEVPVLKRQGFSETLNLDEAL